MSAPTLPHRRADVFAPDLPIHNPSPEGPQRLRALRGSPVVLTFRPPGWDPSPPSHLALFNRLLSRFLGPGEEVVSARHDGIWCMLRLGSTGMRIGLVSPCHGEDSGTSAAAPEAVILLDGKGVVRWRFAPSAGRPAPAEEVLGSLAELAPVQGGAAHRLSRVEFFGATLAATLILATHPATGRASSRPVLPETGYR